MTCVWCKKQGHTFHTCPMVGSAPSVSEPFEPSDTLTTCRECGRFSVSVCKDPKRAGMTGEYSPVYMGAMADKPQRCPGFTKARRT